MRDSRDGERAEAAGAPAAHTGTHTGTPDHHDRHTATTATTATTDAGPVTAP